jgi:hypothetical protein
VRVEEALRHVDTSIAPRIEGATYTEEAAFVLAQEVRRLRGYVPLPEPGVEDHGAGPVQR